MCAENKETLSEEINILLFTIVSESNILIVQIKLWFNENNVDVSEWRVTLWELDEHFLNENVNLIKKP